MRTDRDFVYFKGDDNPHLAQLLEILTSYSVFENGVGYTQGMSDLLSPLMAVIKDEAMVLPPFPPNPPTGHSSRAQASPPCLASSSISRSAGVHACIITAGTLAPVVKPPASIHGTFP